MDKININHISTILEEYKMNFDKLIDNQLFDVGKELFGWMKKINDISERLFKLRFYYFLKGFSSDENDDSLIKLKKYLDKNKYSEYVIQYFENIRVSNSKLGCFLLGQLLTKFLKLDGKPTYEFLSLESALKNVNDMDIINMIEILIYSKESDLEEGCILDDTYLFMKWCQEKNLDHRNLLFTLEKFSNYLVFSREMIMEPDIYIEHVGLGEKGIKGDVHGRYVYKETNASLILFQILEESKDSIISKE